METVSQKFNLYDIVYFYNPFLRKGIIVGIEDTNNLGPKYKIFTTGDEEITDEELYETYTKWNNGWIINKVSEKNIFYTKKEAVMEQISFLEYLIKENRKFLSSKK